MQATNSEGMMLEVRVLNAYYGSAHVLHDVNLSASEGEGLAILGRNGMGKTTLFRSLLGLVPRTSGSIRLAGVELSDMPAYQRARRGLGLVFEDRRMLPHLTVEENLNLGINARDDRASASLEKIYEGFALLRKLRSRLAGNLSGGEQQMIAIARAVMGSPRVLLLDEPAEGLAPVIVQDLVTSLRWLRETYGTTMLIAEHQLWFTRQCTDKVAIISEGQIKFSGSWESFDRDPSLAERYLSVG